jgi:hypothetical protein
VRSVVAGVGAPQIGFVVATVLARLRSSCDGIGEALRSRDHPSLPLARLRSRALPKAKACWPKGPARLFKANQLPWLRPSADVGVAPRR